MLTNIDNELYCYSNNEFHSRLPFDRLWFTLMISFTNVYMCYAVVYIVNNFYFIVSLSTRIQRKPNSNEADAREISIKERSCIEVHWFLWRCVFKSQSAHESHHDFTCSTQRGKWYQRFPVSTTHPNDAFSVGEKCFSDLRLWVRTVKLLNGTQNVWASDLSDRKV